MCKKIFTDFNRLHIFYYIIYAVENAPPIKTDEWMMFCDNYKKDYIEDETWDWYERQRQTEMPYK